MFDKLKGSPATPDELLELDEELLELDDELLELEELDDELLELEELDDELLELEDELPEATGEQLEPLPATSNQVTLPPKLVGKYAELLQKALLALETHSYFFELYSTIVPAT